MLKLTHATLTYISGLVWLAVGLFLLPLGLRLLVENSEATTAIIFIVLGLFIGYAKGKYVLGKSVRRSVTRIQSFPNPTSITNIYSRGY